MKARTEAAVATQIGITQQAVSKRKWIILLYLRRYMTGTSFRHKDVSSPRINGGKPRLVESDKAVKKQIYLVVKVRGRRIAILWEAYDNTIFGATVRDMDETVILMAKDESRGIVLLQLNRLFLQAFTGVTTYAHLWKKLFNIKH